MPKKSPPITDIYLAYRQAKSALFFEKRGVGLSEMARYESDLAANLTALRKKIGKSCWFDQLDLGEVWIVPKRFHDLGESLEGIVRLGVQADNLEARPIDVQARLSPHPDFAIAEVLYLWSFGALIERSLSDDVVGYRLDLREGALSKNRRWLFEYWPKRYQEFRSAPLVAAQEILDSGEAAQITSIDLANFYDTVDPTFLLSKKFLSDLSATGAPLSAIKRFRSATRSLLEAYARYRSIVARRLSVPINVGIPIGALTSRVIANAALASLDSYVSPKPRSSVIEDTWMT